MYNDGYDDHNYDYLIHGDEIFAERYIIKHRVGKVHILSFISSIVYKSNAYRAHLVKLYVLTIVKLKMMLP